MTTSTPETTPDKALASTSLVSELISHRWAAAVACLLIGFLGTVTGLVYDWSLTFGRIWFWVWFILAMILAATGIREWYVNARDATTAD